MVFTRHEMDYDTPTLNDPIFLKAPSCTLPPVQINAYAPHAIMLYINILLQAGCQVCTSRIMRMFLENCIAVVNKTLSNLDTVLNKSC